MARVMRNGRGSAAVAVASPVRCAVYTRKSTDEGLDRDFNSLDNQRQAAEAYIASQRHEGWTCLADRYDDGGFSGGTTERPALKRILADAENGLLDSIVVYRLDRLSRSLIDFVQIHQFLEQRGVALVSVTESINTTTPHGRMMVNVLLSFAQYERELIAERTRHKMHAARKRGKWTGGMPPLGYDTTPEGGKLVVNRDEAEQVRAIFELYVEKGSTLAVAQELCRRGWRRKSWTTRTGLRREGGPWDKVGVRKLLRNPLYAGLQRLGKETYPGEHPAIVPKALWKQVQRMFEGNRMSRTANRPNRHGALLRGLLRCAACDRAMAHQWTRSHGKLYRYYVCQKALKSGWDACATKSVSATAVENFVVEQIKKIGTDQALREEVLRQAQAQLAAERRGLKAEAKRIERERTEAKREVAQLVASVAGVSGAAADALLEALAKAQERVANLDRRLRDVHSRDHALSSTEIDPDALGQALEQFEPIWEVLLTPEKERVIRLLIDRVSYDGSTKQLAITFSPIGITTFAAETWSGETAR